VCVCVLSVRSTLVYSQLLFFSYSPAVGLNDQGEDKVLFEEDDEQFFVDITRTKVGWLIL
jgi:hypothetical protein